MEIISHFLFEKKNTLFFCFIFQDLLEDPTTIKVLHSVNTDASAFLESGVILWNVFDTSVAHDVINYQEHGMPVFQTNSISLQRICRRQGFF